MAIREVTIEPCAKLILRGFVAMSDKLDATISTHKALFTKDGNTNITEK